MDDANAIAIIDSVSHTLAKLILELHEAGLISATDFANSLRRAASDARASAPSRQFKISADIVVQERLADLLDASPQKWVPIVIDGGRSSGKSVRGSQKAGGRLETYSSLSTSRPGNQGQ